MGRHQMTGKRRSQQADLLVRVATNQEENMSKTPAKVAAEAAETTFSAFETKSVEQLFDTTKVTDQFRAFTEKGVEQSKEAYEKLKAGAEEAQKALETTYETAKSVGGDLSLKSIAALRANVTAGFDHLEALVGAKSFSEVIELQTAYLRKRVEMTVEQAKDMLATASKAVEDVSKPVKSIFEKALKELKVA
jgi:phasin